MTLFCTVSNFLAYVSTQFDRTIKFVQCDNERKFDNLSSWASFHSHGMLLQMSCSHTSLQNSKAKCIIFSTNNVTRFGTMGTRLTGLREKDRGPTMSQPTWPRDLGQEAHNLRHLRDI
jgi:hypothetical protein